MSVFELGNSRAGLRFSSDTHAGSARIIANRTFLQHKVAKRRQPANALRCDLPPRLRRGAGVRLGKPRGFGLRVLHIPAQPAPPLRRNSNSRPEFRQVSNPDSFIDEVNEELKREKLFGYMRRYGWIAVVAVIGIVGYASWNEWDKARSQSQAQAFGDAVLAALEHDDGAQRRTALADLARSEAGAGRAGQSRAGIVNLLLSAEQLEAEDRPGAIAALAAVEADASLPTSYRQLATLKRVIIAGADLPVSEREVLLAPLAAPGQPFRPLALEQLALLQLEAGEREAALAQFEALLEEPDLTSGLRRRIAQVIVILGGQIDSDLG